jgi:hypothetical protein
MYLIKIFYDLELFKFMQLTIVMKKMKILK